MTAIKITHTIVGTTKTYQNLKSYFIWTLIDLRKLSLVQRIKYQQTVINTIGRSKYLVFINGERGVGSRFARIHYFCKFTVNEIL